MRIHFIMRGAAWLVALLPLAALGAPVILAGAGFGRLIMWWAGVLADLREARNV